MKNHSYIRTMKFFLSFESISEKEKKPSKLDAIGNCQMLPVFATNP